jgi:hypothetical protein
LSRALPRRGKRDILVNPFKRRTKEDLAEEK